MLRRAFMWTDLAVCVVVCGVALLLRPHTIPWFTGLVLTAAALPLWVLARLQLGSSFSHRTEARRLVSHGLYSRMRHPIYVFGGLAYFGALLALQIWPVLVVWIALTPIEIVRARRESRMLWATFGEEYERYRKSTWF